MCLVTLTPELNNTGGSPYVHTSVCYYSGVPYSLGFFEQRGGVLLSPIWCDPFATVGIRLQCPDTHKKNTYPIAYRHPLQD